MNVNFIIWCLIFLAGIAFELFSPGLFFFLSFAVGAAGAAILSLFYDQINIQLFVFLIITIISLFLLKYVLKFSSRTHANTNIYALIGKHAVVTEEIDPIKGGFVRVNGEIWLAKSKGIAISKDAQVEIIDVKGSHVIVKKI